MHLYRINDKLHAHTQHAHPHARTHTGGTAMAAYGELNLSIIGLIYMFSSETGEAIRLVMTQVRALSCLSCLSHIWRTCAQALQLSTKHTPSL